jgi:ATP sulfurylase
MLSRSEEIPPEFTRPEVAEVLRRHYAQEKGDSAETPAAG